MTPKPTGQEWDNFLYFAEIVEDYRNYYGIQSKTASAIHKIGLFLKENGFDISPNSSELVLYHEDKEETNQKA